MSGPKRFTRLIFQYRRHFMHDQFAALFCCKQIALHGKWQSTSVSSRGTLDRHQDLISGVLLTTLTISVLICCASLNAEEPTQGNPSEFKIREAVNAALPLLEKSSIGSAEQRKCFTCHSQALPIMALSEARLRNFDVDPNNYKRQIKHTAAHLERGQSNYAQGKGQGGGVDTAGYALWTLEVGEYPADQIVDAVTHFLLIAPGTSDHWPCRSHRPPSQSSNFTTTYLSIRALKYYGNENQQDSVQERFQSTLKWLLSAQPRTTEDRVFHLRALDYLDAPTESIRPFATDLLEAQRTDGGWGQTDAMESDPYATATALVGLIRTGQTDRNQAAFGKGISYLLKQQTAQGSWHVKSRSKPFQKYFETGFPHEKDQFISTSATAWATIALLLALPTHATDDVIKTTNQNEIRE